MGAVDQAAFEIFLNGSDRIETSLDDLLSTNEGRAFWVENGFSWDGKFNINPESENSFILNNYLIEKGLDPL